MSTGSSVATLSNIDEATSDIEHVKCTQIHIPSNVDEVNNTIEDLVYNSAGPSNVATGIYDSVDVHQGVQTVAGDSGNTSNESGDGAQSIVISGPFDEDVRVFIHSTLNIVDITSHMDWNPQKCLIIGDKQ
ncbi:hypothetical protein P692DRAFT_20821834 [Suillus brevipes Sb2]|nr:hypothetical protein P692DRAFT_20821834 [Suillus brevipes Sb2]